MMLHRETIAGRLLRFTSRIGAAVVRDMLPGGSVGAEPGLAADVLLRGGTLYDGSGREAAVADLAIQAGKIVAVGKLGRLSAGRVIDCRGLIVAPGHRLAHPLRSGRTARDAHDLNYLTQGCTTVVSGNCGMGSIDIAAYFSPGSSRDGSNGTNVILLAAARTGSRKSDGRRESPANPPRSSSGCRRSSTARWRGGLGHVDRADLSAGNVRQDGRDRRALAKVVARHRGMYASHIRNEAADLLRAARRSRSAATRLPVHISHLKAVGPANWVRCARRSRHRRARAEGLTVTADQYPYIATSTNPAAILFRQRSCRRV